MHPPLQRLGGQDTRGPFAYAPVIGIRPSRLLSISCFQALAFLGVRVVQRRPPSRPPYSEQQYAGSRQARPLPVD